MDLVKWAQDKRAVWENIEDKYGGNIDSF